MCKHSRLKTQISHHVLFFSFSPRRRRSNQRGGRGGGPRGEPLKFDSEFDFESANEKFNKEDIEKVCVCSVVADEKLSMEEIAVCSCIALSAARMCFSSRAVLIEVERHCRFNALVEVFDLHKCMHGEGGGGGGG